MISRALLCSVLLLHAVLISPLRAEVARLQIAGLEPFAEGQEFAPHGAYERMWGRLLISIDPQDPANSVPDIKLAPTDQQGRVSFWTDFYLLKPVQPQPGFGRLLFEVNNRGNKLLLAAMNGARGNTPASRADAGNGFLMRQGYSILWVAWNGDVEPGEGRQTVDLPIARKPDGDGPLTGRAYSEFCVDAPARSQPLCGGNTRVYAAWPLDQPDATLTMRPRREAEPVEVPRGRWRFARTGPAGLVPDPGHLYLEDGFRPGWLYDLVYVARDPRVSGLGAVAVRDAVSFFRHTAVDEAGTPNPLAGAIERAHAFGISQSARFLHHFLAKDFNADLQGRPVFDGILAHVGGAATGIFDQRFVQITRHGSTHEDRLYPTDTFPFATVPQADVATGRTGDWLERSRRAGHLPKIMLTQTSGEYWGRAASLLHTSPDGREDLAIDPSVRLYVIAGAQHLFAPPSETQRYRYPVNTLDYTPILRAALVALDRWTRQGMTPPESCYPHTADGTLVDISVWRKQFPAIPGVQPPNAAYAPYRLDCGPRWETEGIADHVPPRVNGSYATLVPAVDSDGNDVAGIRLPQVAAPLATHAGWNQRSAAVGAEGAMARWVGSQWMLPRTPAEREARGDPRPPIPERYAGREAYLQRVHEAAARLCERRFLLEEDLPRVVQAAEAAWNRAVAAD